MPITPYLNGQQFDPEAASVGGLVLAARRPIKLASVDRLMP
jgi:hypothetical protein